MTVSGARSGGRWACNTASPSGGTARLFGLQTSMVTVYVQFIQVQTGFPMNIFTPVVSRSFTTRFKVLAPAESLGATSCLRTDGQVPGLPLGPCSAPGRPRTVAARRGAEPDLTGHAGP